MRKIAAVGCGAVLAASGGVAMARTIEQGQSSSGRTVTVKRGDTIKVTLGGASGSTGYAWEQPREPPANVLRFVGESIEQVNCPPHVVGCPQNTTFTYRARGRGRARITLRLMPPSKGAKPAKRFTETVIVK